MGNPVSDQGIDPIPDKLDLTRVPVHIACVMDGNGRWANARGLARTEGHAAGEEALLDVVNGALAIGVRWITLYAFSTENSALTGRRGALLDGVQRIVVDAKA